MDPGAWAGSLSSGLGLLAHRAEPQALDSLRRSQTSPLLPNWSQYGWRLVSQGPAQRPCAPALSLVSLSVSHTLQAGRRGSHSDNFVEGWSGEEARCQAGRAR